MKIKILIACALMLGGFVLSRPLFAHHSSAAFDMEHPITLKGTVSSLEWGNPHIYIYLDVKDDNGATEQWRVEGNSPNMLVRSGWKKEMIKAGDQLTVYGAPAKNKSAIMRLLSLTLANGQKFDGQGFK
jgi:Family of unknown function (DUF6152)